MDVNFAWKVFLQWLIAATVSGFGVIVGCQYNTTSMWVVFIVVMYGLCIFSLYKAFNYGRIARMLTCKDRLNRDETPVMNGSKLFEYVVIIEDVHDKMGEPVGQVAINLSDKKVYMKHSNRWVKFAVSLEVFKYAKAWKDGDWVNVSDLLKGRV